MAFIPGDGLKRKPLFKCLPTLEKHRNLPTFLAFLEMKTCYVDKIFIGDLTITDWTLQQFQSYADGIIPLRVNKEQNYPLWNIIHRNRLDAARDVVRSENARIDVARFENGKTIEPANTIHRPIGSITLDNQLYGRYEGELQITLIDLPADEKVNVLGNVIQEDQPLLKYVKKGGSRFSFHML